MTILHIQLKLVPLNQRLNLRLLQAVSYTPYCVLYSLIFPSLFDSQHPLFQFLSFLCECYGGETYNRCSVQPWDKTGISSCVFLLGFGIAGSSDGLFQVSEFYISVCLMLVMDIFVFDIRSMNIEAYKILEYMILPKRIWNSGQLGLVLCFSSLPSFLVII